MVDFYKVLGVSQSATRAAIKAAYRSAAQKAHPDKGGDSEAFHLVQQAFDTLYNPEARSHYDETGDVLLSDAQQKTALALGELCELLGQVVELVDPNTADVLDIVRININRHIAKNDEDKAELSSKILRLTTAASRVSIASGENVFKLSLERRAAQYRGKMEKAVALGDKYAEMLRIASTYSYERILDAGSGASYSQWRSIPNGFWVNS